MTSQNKIGKLHIQLVKSTRRCSNFKDLVKKKYVINTSVAIE